MLGIIAQIITDNDNNSNNSVTSDAAVNPNEEDALTENMDGFSEVGEASDNSIEVNQSKTTVATSSVYTEGTKKPAYQRYADLGGGVDARSGSGPVDVDAFMPPATTTGPVDVDDYIQNSGTGEGLNSVSATSVLPSSSSEEKPESPAQKAYYKEILNEESQRQPRPLPSYPTSNNNPPSKEYDFSTIVWQVKPPTTRLGSIDPQKPMRNLSASEEEKSAETPLTQIDPGLAETIVKNCGASRFTEVQGQPNPYVSFDENGDVVSSGIIPRKPLNTSDRENKDIKNILGASDFLGSSTVVPLFDYFGNRIGNEYNRASDVSSCEDGFFYYSNTNPSNRSISSEALSNDSSSVSTNEELSPTFLVPKNPDPIDTVATVTPQLRNQIFDGMLTVSPETQELINRFKVYKQIKNHNLNKSDQRSIVIVSKNTNNYTPTDGFHQTDSPCQQIPASADTKNSKEFKNTKPQGGGGFRFEI